MAPAGEAGPCSCNKSWEFSRLLQINRAFCGTFLSDRSQAMLGLLSICLQTSYSHCQCSELIARDETLVLQHLPLLLSSNSDKLLG